MKLNPKFARVIIERDKPKATGIIIPETAEKRNAPAWGRVVACGPTCDDDIKKLVGKMVLFGRFAGDWVKAPDGTEFYIVQEEDILADIEE